MGVTLALELNWLCFGDASNHVIIPESAVPNHRGDLMTDGSSAEQDKQELLEELQETAALELTRFKMELVSELPAVDAAFVLRRLTETPGEIDGLLDGYIDGAHMRPG